MQHQHSLPKPGTVSRYADFDGSSDALFLAQIAQQAKPVAVITANAPVSYTHLTQALAQL